VKAGAVLPALAGALLGWALFFGGGDSAARLTWIGGAAVLVAALAAAAAFLGKLARPQLGRPAQAFVVCAAAFVLWQGISITWSVEPDRSWDYLNRGLVYLAFLAIGTFVGAIGPRALRLTAGGLAALLALVLAYAFLAKGIPSLYPDYGRVARLRSPIGLWNTLALLGDFALVLGLWRAAQKRFDGVLLVFAAILAVLLAYSRGGILIAFIVVAGWLALDRRRLESLLALVVGGGGAVAVFGIALALPGITSDNKPHSVRAHDGPLFLLAVAVAAISVAVAGRALLQLQPAAATRRRATIALLATIGVVCVAGIAVASSQGRGSTNLSAAGAHCTQGARRLVCGSSDERFDWWKQAWHMFEDKPLVGRGAGSFELAHRLRSSVYTRPTTEPHNFALQSLGETGIVGFLLFFSAVALAAIAVSRRLRDGAAAVALALCAVAYLVHILVDVGYDFVAVSASFFTLLGVLLATSRPPAGRDPVWAFGSPLLAAAAVLSLAAPYVAQRDVDRAVATDSPALAARAHSWNPVSIAPPLTEAALEEARGNNVAALRLYRQAIDIQPENPEAWVELGQFELEGLRDACSAYATLDHAYGLDRFNSTATKGGALDVARTRASRQGCR
jgi:hypothetical protein